MDLYVVLGIRRGASDAEIRRAYRRLARQYHPDINPGDREAAARFHDISRAYETLADPDRRHQQEFLQKLSDPPQTRCTQCGQETFSKMVTAAGFQLKGSGWYATDFKNKGPAPSKPGEAKPAESRPAESKPAQEGTSGTAKESSTPASTPASGGGTPTP